MYDRYAGLIFDMDGTLIDTEPTHRKAWRQVLARYGMHYDLDDMTALNGSPTWRIAEAIIAFNHASLNPHQLAGEKTRLLNTMLLDEARLLPLIEVVKRWYGRRPMAVGTGSESSVANALLTHLGIKNYFAAIVAADDVIHPKPAPETFLRCAELMSVPASRCVVFEDAEFGIEAAQRAGMDVIDVRTLPSG